MMLHCSFTAVEDAAKGFPASLTNSLWQETKVWSLRHPSLSQSGLICSDRWVALGPPVQAMGFDFYDADTNMQPLQVPPAHLLYMLAEVAIALSCRLQYVSCTLKGQEFVDLPNAHSSYCGDASCMLCRAASCMMCSFVAW